MTDKPKVTGIMNKGWLWKHGGRVRNWKRRFFVLTTAGRLAYYASESDAESNTGALGIIDVQKALYVTRRVKGEEPGAWPDAVPANMCFTIITNDRNYGVYAEDEKATDKWVQQLAIVRGDTEKTEDVTVQQVPDQRRGSMSTGMSNFCLRHKLMDLAPKIQAMWMKWNNVGHRALKALADHFAIVEEIVVVCDAGDMYSRLPINKRARIGEYVFADYMDELRHNLITEFGDEQVAKSAFREAFTKRKIKVELSDDDFQAPNTVQMVDGTLVLTIFKNRFGSGMHLAGKFLTQELTVTEEKTISSCDVSGMRADAVISLLRHAPAVETTCAQLREKLPGKPEVKFVCKYKDVEKELDELDGSMAHQLGSCILKPIVMPLLSDLLQFASKCEPEAADRMAGESGEFTISFQLGKPDGTSDPCLKLTSEGQLMIVASARKVIEIKLYNRPPLFNVKELLA